MKKLNINLNVKTEMLKILLENIFDLWIKTSQLGYKTMNHDNNKKDKIYFIKF